MPFKSEKQRRWMHANNPKMAAKWEKKEKKMKREQKVRELIKKMVREELAGLDEAAKRDYKAEYKKFQSSDKSKKYRAELNKYNRQKGTYGNGDGKDASHKGGKIVGFEKESVNRGRAEKSRLKKEGKLTEDFKNNEWEVYVADEKGKEKIMKVAKSKRAGVILYNKLINTDKYHEVGMRVIKEGKLKETLNKLTEKLSKSEIKKMRDKFDKTGKLPPHLVKLSKLIDKHTEIKNVIVPGLEWMADIDEGKITEAKETIFDVAAKVMKDSQNYNYKSKKGMVKVDMQTANLLTKVWKKVSPQMKKHLAGMGESNPAGLVQTLWAAVK